MKRVRMLSCVVAVFGALAGCGVTVGDGDLTNNWTMLGAPKVPEPVAGDCWTLGARGEQTGGHGLGAGPCDVEHDVETVKVGHFTGSVADSSSPPSPSPLSDAWTDCDKAASDYLGAPWQDGRVHVMVKVPTSRQWSGGARFYRCDVAALHSEAGVLALRRTTLKGTVAPGGEMRLSCGTAVSTAQSTAFDITPSACTDPHDEEYVGSVTSAATNNDYPADSKAANAAFGTMCEAKVISYVGMSRSHWAKQPALFAGFWGTAYKDEWTAGNHTARCYLELDKKKINRSLQGAGDVNV